MLETARKDGTLVLTLNRPEKRNSLHPDLINALAEVLVQADRDESLAAIVVTGAGTSFCAGLDLSYLLSLNPDGKVAYLRSFFDLFRAVYSVRQPVIAAVNGPAIAGGFDLATACDLRLCSPTATFAQTEVLLGITQIMYPLYEVIGLGRAKELALTGQHVLAEEAFRIGLVNCVCPADRLLETALTFGAQLASRPRQAVFATKRLSRELIQLNTESALNLMFEVISERLRSEEHRVAGEKYVAGLKQR